MGRDPPEAQVGRVGASSMKGLECSILLLQLLLPPAPVPLLERDLELSVLSCLASRPEQSLKSEPEVEVQPGTSSVPPCALPKPHPR